jgi:ABC-type polysaccharide/polyol phosphate transport system, ATPase component
MNPDSLVVENVGKVYREYASEMQRFARWFGAPVVPVAEHWVLRHVSFKVAAGEAIGIIGQNGAGKSTLLKMIAGTALPNEGKAATFGRVSALLELGLGFNPELSGRENARHAAGLMGIEGPEIDRLIPQIEAFAEVGDYFDQSMRTYSSGMQMRVAFSVATAIRPDVLIVDEALAVGDAYFVHKCYQRIRQFREAGTTLLIVSHDPSAVQALCDRAILLDGGRLVLDGPPQEVFDYYNALIAEKENSGVRTQAREGLVATESGSGEAVFEQLDILDAQGRPVEYIEVGRPVSIRARVRVVGDIDRLVFGYMIRDRLGQPIYGTNTHHTGQVLDGMEAGDLVEFRVYFPANLGTGSYSVSVALASAETHLVRNYQWKDLALVFTVANVDHPMFVGLAHIPPRIEIVRTAAVRAAG